MSNLWSDQKTVARDDEPSQTIQQAPAFTPGSLVAGRYRIACFIARGGMGEVYAAEDVSLHEPVALKTIRPELAALPGALLRFKRELRLARRVTHPNVCRVFDLGEHALGAAGQEPPSLITFLTMELLEGRTLQEYLLDRGRLTQEQVLPLAEQMAAALDALHAEQIIHRDFKTGNVMLVPSPSVAGSLRAVVTDFGLAQGELLEGEGTATREGQLVGSPAYMSPEQVKGQPLTPASDLYSFGVVLFELLTGRRPFVADTSMATALLRLQDPVPSPREWAPELPPAWEQTLLRCLEREPKARFASASEVVAQLRAASRGSSPGASPSPPVTVPARWQGSANGTETAVADYSQAATRKMSVPRLPLVVQSVARPVVAVLAPRNLMGGAGPAWLSTALAELLSAELAVGEQLRLLSGEDVVRMRGDLSLPEQEGFAADTLRRMQVHSGVDWVLTGAYVLQGQEEAAQLRVNLRLQEASSGETRAHLTELGAERKLLELVSRLGGTLRKRLGLESLTPEQSHQVRSTLPATAEAARLYTEGLVALRAHDAAGAIERFERVVQQHSTFAPAHSALAAAFQSLYQEEAARQAARRAFELADGLSREERLLVSARYHEAQAQWPQAVEAYRTLFGFFPDHVEYGIALVYAQLSAGQAREAQGTLESLRQLPGPPGQDARIALAAAVVTSSTADFPASRRAAQEAVEQARQAGQSQLTASALVLEAYALRNLGEPLEAVVLLEESGRLFLAGGDRGGAARSMLVHAMALIDTGRLREAERVISSTLQTVQALKGASLEAEVLVNAGGLSCHLGDLTEALRRSRGALELFRRTGRLPEMNSSTILLGRVRRLRGELDEARRLLEEGSHASQVLFEDDYTEAWARYELGWLMIHLDALKSARRHLERSLELRRARGLGAFVAETELALAHLALEEGRPGEALTSVDSALAAHAALHQPDQQGFAYTVRARVLHALGDAPGAWEALERARALAGHTEEAFVAAEIALTGARLVLRKIRGPEREQLALQLQALARRAARGGLRGVELEARLLRVELDLHTLGAPAAGELPALRQMANRLGYRGLLRRANAL